MTNRIVTTPVTSSQIAAIGHDPENQVMAVTFTGKGGQPGATYHYSNVDLDTFAAFRDAESKGSHFKRVFKDNPGKYPYTRVTE